MNKKQTTKEQIDEIMDYFDFAKVRRVMEFLDWGWSDSNGGLEIPSEYQLRKKARSLLQQVAESEEEKSIMCGGFVAERFEGKDEEEGDYWVSLNLAFWVEDLSFYETYDFIDE